MKRLSLKDTSTRAPKDFEKDATKKKTSDILNKLDDLQNLLVAEGKHSVPVVIKYPGQSYQLIRTGIKNL